MLAELTEAANKAQIKERDRAQTTEFIEGSDSLSMMTITANYEGTYRNLLNFIGELDRSDRLLIIESMSAAPQQGSNILTVSMKIDAFLRDESRGAGRRDGPGGAGGSAMKLAPSGVGAEPKKLAILGVLLVAAGGAYYWRAGPRYPPAQTRPRGRGEGAARRSAGRTRFAATRPATSSYGPRVAVRGGRGSASGDDFRPTLKLPEGMDISRIDPTLKLDLLAKVRRVSVEGGSRSLFEFYTPPPPPVPQTEARSCQSRCKVAEAKPADQQKGPAPPPPPPPIPLKFYGYSGALRSAARKAFFLDGEDIVQAGENETIRNRYKILRIGVNSAVVEDTVAKNQQTLPLAAEAP